MIRNMSKHIFMIDKSNCVTFELIKRRFSGSDEMPLNTLCPDVLDGFLGSAVTFYIDP